MSNNPDDYYLAIIKAYVKYLELSATLNRQAVLRLLRLGTPTKNNRQHFLQTISRQLVSSRTTTRTAAYTMWRLLSALSTGQTISYQREQNPTYRLLVKQFEQATGQKLNIKIPPGTVKTVQINPPPTSNTNSWQKRFTQVLDKQIARSQTGTPPENIQTAIAESAARIVKDTARNEIVALASNDKKVLGWVRVPTNANPCAFCALLASRATLSGDHYRSEYTALYSKYGEKYHDNCGCQAVPIFTIKDLRSPVFNLARKAAQTWKNYGGGTRTDGLYNYRRAWEERTDSTKHKRWTTNKNRRKK